MKKIITFLFLIFLVSCANNEVKPKNIALEKEWKLIAYGSQGDLRKIDEEKFVLNFLGEPRFEGRQMLNKYAGKYFTRGNRIDMDIEYKASIHEPNKKRDYEEWYFDALENVKEYWIQGNVLSLKTNRGKILKYAIR